MADKKVHGFDAKSSKRIAETVRHDERTRIIEDQTGTGKGQGQRFGLEARLAKLDAELTDGSSASATIWYWDEDTSDFIASARQVTVYDWMLGSGDTVASGGKIAIVLIGSKWMVVAANCD